ncbi:relaxase domain-containing protein [Streptomyces goshikiensis]|uniref:relaxase domain-containing protein n=1 Tax=Streptomyces goshikiensis TaxID=1942 RepID=UPI00364FF959
MTYWRTLFERIECHLAVIRFGTDGVYRVQPPDGLVAARFRHPESRAGMPLLHDHLLPSIKRSRDSGWTVLGADRRAGGDSGLGVRGIDHQALSVPVSLAVKFPTA